MKPNLSSSNQSGSESNATPSDAKSKNDEAKGYKERNEALKSIPIIGPFLVYIVVSWGWTGILLFLAGIISSFLLIFFNLIPEKLNALLHKHKVSTSNNVSLLSKDVNWSNLVSAAKSNIQASGYYLNGFDANNICKALESNRSLKVDIALTDPEGQAICIRQEDEKNPRTYGRIVSKINEINDNCDADAKRRLKLKLVDVYPTMSVVIIDDHLYAYFYAQDPLRGSGAYGTRSPVILIQNHSIDPLAEHFTSHLMNTSKAGKQVGVDIDYEHYKALPSNRDCTSVPRPQ